MVIYFDGSRCEKSGGAGIIFVTPQGVPIPYFKLNFPCTNNIDKYEVCYISHKDSHKIETKKG